MIDNNIIAVQVRNRSGVVDIGLFAAHDKLVRQQIAFLATRLEVAYKFYWRTADMLDKGLQPSVEASALKLICTELSRKMADMSMDIMGPYGQLTGSSPWTPIRGMIPKGYLDCISATVGAGSSEIQRNIVAQRGLGLPRK